MSQVLIRGLIPKQNQFMALRAMSDGAIKKEGGKLAKKAAADENQYIRQLEREQLKALRDHHHEEIADHENEIKRLQDKITQHKARLDKLKSAE